MKKKLFFDATTEAIRSLGGAMDDFAAALIAIKNMRCEVQGVLSEWPDVTDEKLNARYNCGCGVNWRNYRKPFRDQSFESIVISFSWHLLYSACAVFESWLDKMHQDGFISEYMVKDLQFPLRARKCLNRNLSGNRSTLMRNTMYPAYSQNPKFRLKNIEELLYGYRLFKEMRNSAIHSGRIVTAKCLNAYNAYVIHCSKAALGVTEVPEVDTMVQGAEIIPRFRGMIGFTDLVIKILVTYDAELIKTSNAENYFVKKYEAKCDKHQILSANAAREHKQINNNLSASGFCYIKNTDEIKRYFAGRGFRYL